MRTSIFTLLLICLVPGVVLASDQDIIIIDENGVGWAIDDNGNKVPFNLDDIEVLASRPSPKKPGFCINSENFTLWWGGEGWHVCWVDEWEDIDTPTLSVLLGGKLAIGEFISSDNNHTVEAVIEDVERIEQWSSIDKSGFSGILDFNPKTAKEPTIIFKVGSVAKGTGRTKSLAYTVKAKLGSLTAESAKFEQTNVHQLRQEYVDVDQKKTPAASKFDLDLTRFGGHPSSCYFNEKRGGTPCRRPVLRMRPSFDNRWWNWYELDVRQENWRRSSSPRSRRSGAGWRRPTEMKVYAPTA